MINKKFKYNSMNVIIICVILSFLSLSQAEITLTIGNGAGYPGSEGNQVDISLDNQDDEVGGVQIDICDVDDYLSCTECNLTERTVDFTCLCYEQKNGCAGVVLYSPTCNFIDKDTGPIFSISYNVSEEAPPGECRDLNSQNIVVSDMFGNPLSANANPGEFCFVGCGDICPPDDSLTPGWDCGDGVVDIYDLMCEIEFAMSLNTPDECQAMRVDLPTGTPGLLSNCPSEDIGGCCPPDGQVDILDIMVIIDMAQGKSDCCNHYYTGAFY